MPHLYRESYPGAFANWFISLTLTLIILHKMKKYILASFAFLVTCSLFAQYSATQITSFYKSQQAQWSLTGEDVANFVITNQYTSVGSGVTHIYLRQVVNGVEVFNANTSMHISKEGNLITLNNGFVANASEKAAPAKPSIAVSSALNAAGNHVGMNLAPVMSKADIPMQNNRLSISDPSISPEPVKAGLYYLQTESGLVLTYNVEVFDNTTNDWWNVRVNANDGSVIEKNNWTTHCNVASHMFDNENASSYNHQLLAPTQVKKVAAATEGTYNIFPFPVESPNHGPRTLLQANPSLTASPYGWHDTDGVAGPEFTTTKGNNVYADEDSLASNGTGFSPDGGQSLLFDYPLDSTWMEPTIYLNAAITQLFYANNYLHDLFYRYGFNELSGNYQMNNYGKGGLGKDQVMADAQDGSGTGNANFAAPSDGSSGRMQMYLWPTTTVTAPKLAISSPLSAVGNYNAPLAQFGTKRFADINSRVVLVDDNSASSSQGCNAIQNVAELTGKIALIDRGTCSYTQKVLNAQTAGAIGAIVINTSNTATAMTGSNSNITIPAVMVSSTDGAKLKAAITNGDTLEATMKGMPTVKAYDSDFDNGVIAHEFGHGISIRLTGGPANSNCLSNAEQQGEGWSDFFALALTAKPGDLATDARGIGTFVSNQAVGALGIREYKYSTNMSVNPMTYTFIKNNKGVHYVGTVWCTMLWDIYWGMVDKYGFDADVMNGSGGNNKMIQLVIDGLKLQPCSPGFVDSRNAIIKADSILNGGANRELIWKAFSRRGLGYTAIQGSSSSVSDGTAKFDLPPDITGLADKANLAVYIQISPNPTTGVATLVLPDQLTKAQLTVTDITGKVVINELAYTDGNQHITVDMSAYQNGLYLVKLTSGATTYQSKLMVNR
jgi:extracellular elastinolytic metalloproteinase